MRAHALIAVILATACQPDAPAIQPPAITSSSDNGLQFEVAWVTDGDLATTLSVDCGEYTAEIAEEDALTDHRAVVLGLWDGATCDVVVSADGEEPTAPKTFTATVPDWLPQLEVLETSPDLSPGWTLLTLAREGADSPGSVAMFDEEGRFRWVYPRWEGQGSPAPGFDVRTVPADPEELEIVAGADTAVMIGGFTEAFGPAIVTWDGRIAWEGALDMHHEIAPFGGAAVLYIGYDTCGDQATNALYSLDLDSGAKDWTWRSCDHLAPVGPGGDDWDHLNSFDLVGSDDAGDVVATARNLDLLVYIDRLTGAVRWTAGVNGTIPVAGDDVFYGPHAVESLGDGRFLFVDNGEPDVRESTRIVELEVDDAAGTASVVWSVEPGPFTPILGDANRLPNGNTLVVLGTADTSDSHVYEYGPDGELLWHVLVTEGWTPNRAERVAEPPGALLLP